MNVNFNSQIIWPQGNSDVNIGRVLFSGSGGGELPYESDGDAPRLA